MRIKLIKILAIISLVALCFLSAQGLFSCRSQKRNKIRADSTVVRSQQKTENWTSETVTEVLLDPEDVAKYLDSGSNFPFPSIFGLSTPESRKVFSKLGLIKRDTDSAIASTSTPEKQKGKVLIRKTEKVAGRKESNLEEKKQVAVSEKSSSKEPSSGSGWIIGIGLTIFSALIIIIILYKSKRRD